VGFQIDVTHSYDVNEQMKDGSYGGDFHLQAEVPRGPLGNLAEVGVGMQDLREVLGAKGDADVAEILLAHNTGMSLDRVQYNVLMHQQTSWCPSHTRASSCAIHLVSNVCWAGPATMYAAPRCFRCVIQRIDPLSRYVSTVC